ncbi:ABC transporter substrate-binding protein [Qaidamihabitans albus]|uniref:ABC transporter substrate-binding protein n=1 Tax=Qaidamihabitans albus TaxID=2795733 RepID=UPI0018F24C84|nr:ABC transporter substrate-binding protein [Qaidamihabitans albus]
MSLGGSRKRLARWVVPIAALALAGTACFPDTSAPGGDNTGDGGQEQDAGPPQPGGIYRYSLPSDAQSLDPHKQSSYNTHVAIGASYSKLVDFKTGPDTPYGSYELEGDLAEDWSVSEDGGEWTFNLRKGVKFHNVAPVNGREFTARDVLCTTERIRQLPGHQVNLLSMVEDIEAPDDHTVVFRLTQPYADFATNMANHFMWMLPCEGTEGKFDLGTQAIGTGPFVLERWERNRERVLTAHPEYYERGKPYLDGIHVAIVPDPQASMAAMRTGKLDYLTSLSFDEKQAETLLSQQPDFQLRSELGLNPIRVYMNQAAEPFDDVRVRRAVALAIDRAAMVESLRPGGQASGPVTPSLFGGLPSEEVERLQPYDPEQARRLLAEAGYPDGFRTEMILTNGYGETVVREAQWVQQDLAKVGIDVSLDVQDYATYFTESFAKQRYQLGFGLQTPMLSADEYLSTEWHSEGSRNWYGIDDPELDRMIAEQRGILDEAARERKLADIQRYIINEVSNPVTLNLYETQVIYAPYVHGSYPHPEYGGRHLADVWLGPEAPGRQS